MNIFLNQMIAQSYDAFYESPQGKTTDALEKKLIENHLTPAPSKELLELGCGTGHWTSYFSQLGYRVTAIDESQVMLDVARQKKISNAEFVLGDASTLPFEDESVPLIASITMLEFVNTQKKVVDEMYRVLQPGGMLVLGCLNILSELGKNSHKDEVFKHARLFSPSEVELIVSRFGEPRLSYGVYYAPDFQLLDNTDRQNQVKPAFIVASAFKTK